LVQTTVQNTAVRPVEQNVNKKLQHYKFRSGKSMNFSNLWRRVQGMLDARWCCNQEVRSYSTWLDFFFVISFDVFSFDVYFE